MRAANRRSLRPDTFGQQHRIGRFRPGDLHDLRALISGEGLCIVILS
jgi:hypothetical protein